MSSSLRLPLQAASGDKKVLDGTLAALEEAAPQHRNTSSVIGRPSRLAGGLHRPLTSSLASMGHLARSRTGRLGAASASFDDPFHVICVLLSRTARLADLHARRKAPLGLRGHIATHARISEGRSMRDFGGESRSRDAIELVRRDTAVEEAAIEQETPLVKTYAITVGGGENAGIQPRV